MTLQQLLIEELQDLYDAEHQQLAALPRLAAAAHGSALRGIFSSHLEASRTHVTRLEEVFALAGTQPTRRHCRGIECIIEEGAKMLRHADIDGAVLDAGLIASAQKVEHYEMSGYGTCIAWARTLGLHQIAARLEETLQDEQAADQTLSDVAEREVNISATHEAT